jgi:hypothetical protein
MSPPRPPVAPIVFLLPTAPDYASMLSSKESVANEILAWAKRRIMNNPIGEKELENLLAAARAAGRAEGYAQAKYEMALERARAVIESPQAEKPRVSSEPLAPNTEKLVILQAEAKKIEDSEAYKTRMTVSMTKAIALDYIKNAAPRIVGPSEIKKNSEKNLSVFISYGTLKRAMDGLVEAGEVEQVEPSRWRYKPAVALKSVR